MRKSLILRFLNVKAHSCKVLLMEQEWYIHCNDLKEKNWVNETLKLVALRVTALLQREDLDKMEREILERYHRQQWFTPWQLQLLQTIEQLRFDLSQSNPTNIE